MPALIDIILPVKNEAQNLEPLLKRIDATFSKTKEDYQVIAVDDHSTDNSYQVLTQLTKKFPLKIFKKSGKPGKAFSILQGAKHGKAPFVGMIDADLEYPPEALPELLEVAKDGGMAVARRETGHHSKFRTFLSKGFQFFFGRLLYGFSCDVQSGLKVFRREVIDLVDEETVSGWTVDIPLLESAKGLNFTIGEVPIEFATRKAGKSKINLWQSVTEIGGQAIKYKLSNSIKQLPPDKKDTMVGAGIVKKYRRFVTHTTLQPHLSALQTFTNHQKLFIFLLLLTLFAGLTFTTLTTLKIFVAILSFVYFLDVIFNLLLIIKSLHQPPEISPDLENIKKLKDKDLPVYSIMCPLYKEAEVLPHFLEAIEKINWPKQKLDVMLLLEADDQETIAVAKKMKLPSYVRILVVPDSQPKTKPKACNYGLNYAKGEYVVIYDAEDIPDPLQLKKVYLGFQQVSDNVRCLQAKLNYHNPHQNLLTRFFTAEYSLWFDVILTGLQSIQTSIPLGGTSNHFRTADLKELRGWDPFNVTEDCDLGVRLFKKGYKTAIVDSITLEEANSNWRNWLRQRSRWIKGYMQTYLIHMRNPLQFLKENGIHAILFQLIVGGKIAFMFINPLMWILTISYFSLYAVVGPAIESLYPSVIFYMAVVSLLFGNFMFMYYYMIGAAKREQWSLIKFVFLIPVYWLMVSIAACIALYQLITKPHYWEKTIHGLHLKKEQVKEEVEETAKEIVAEIATEAEAQKKPFPVGVSILSLRKRKIFIKIYQQLQQFSSPNKLIQFLKKSEYKSASLLVIATVMANGLNMLGQFYLGARLPIEEFAIMNTYISLAYLLAIPYAAFGSTINHQVAKILGRTDQTAWFTLWKKLTRKTLVVGLILSWIWLITTPFLQQLFGWTHRLPLYLFAPLLVINLVFTVNDNYLRGKLSFAVVALTVIVEPLTRLLSSIAFIELGFSQLVMLSIPLGILLATLISLPWIIQDRKDSNLQTHSARLPWNFFSLALLARLSSVAFFTLDNILVATFLSTYDTGRYGLLGLLGKMIFFSGSLITGFILPIVSHREGKGVDSRKLFGQLMLLTVLITGAGFAALGVGLPLLAPLFAQERLSAIVMFLPMYCLGIASYTLAQNIVQYHLAKREYSFAWLSFIIALLQISGLAAFHQSLQQVVAVMAISGIANVVLLSVLHRWHNVIRFPLKNIQDLLDLFGRLPQKKYRPNGHYRVLIFNWRDTRHVWAGGAEVYVHELAKELVKRGHNVTVFCGNDGHAPRNQVIDGVQMVRRGGFFTIYFWAPLYYLFKFHDQFDIVIDSENGIPFFTPLFVRVPKILLIHHVHQEVFRTGLPLPLAMLAETIESFFMPLFYHGIPVVTVSASSKKALLALGLSKKREVSVINPGVNSKDFPSRAKTKKPTIAYMGRLKPYKHIDVAIRAFSRIAGQFPEATFLIAGTGESYNDLKKLIKKLKVHKQVKLLGQVSDQDKVKLLAKSWFVVQPSMIEGWGITVIEANAAGTPVIASNVAGLKDSVADGKTGLLVKANDVAAFSKAMTDLLTNHTKRTQLSESAKLWSSQFSWENNTDQLLTIFDHLLSYTEVKKINGFAMAESYSTSSSEPIPDKS